MKPVRTLDLSSFVGDTWAVQATQAVPPAGLLMRAENTMVRISLRPRDGLAPDAATVTDTDTQVDVRIVVVKRDERDIEFPEFLASVEETTAFKTLLGRNITEEVDQGWTIAVGFPAVVTGAGSAAAFSVYVEGATPIAEFVV